MTKRVGVDAVAEESNAIANDDAVLGQERAGAGRHDARQIVAGKGYGAVVGAGGEDQRARSHDDGLILSNDESLLGRRCRRPLLRCKDARPKDSGSARPVLGVNRRATRRRRRRQCVSPVCTSRPVSGQREPRPTCADDEHIDLLAACGARRGEVLPESAQPRHVSCHLLHHERSCRDPGHEMVVVDALGKKPVGDLQQIDLARAEHVLGLHAARLLGKGEASHHVRLAVDPSQTTVTAPRRQEGPWGR